MRKRGGKVTGSVSNKTSYLVVGESGQQVDQGPATGRAHPLRGRPAAPWPAKSPRRERAEPQMDTDKRR
ncbi:MAG: hypothetical protein R3A10_13400 [Caldilineaceae bacterium]